MASDSVHFEFSFRRFNVLFNQFTNSCNSKVKSRLDPRSSNVSMSYKYPIQVSLFCKYRASNVNNLQICFSNAYADWMSLAMIAASLCSEVTSLGQQTIFSSRRNRILILIFIRVYGFVLLIPTNLGVSLLGVPTTSQILTADSQEKYPS